MARLRCRTCGGVFESVQADGLAYYHACPVQGGRDPQPGRERPNRRDENIDPAKARGRRPDTPAADLIKAHGLGVEPAP